MTWKIRHEGSPQAVEGLTPTEIVEGLQDGLWEPMDEVMGPDDRGWQAIESHPQFAEIAADIEPPPPRSHEDETRLDMNPLIDVCLVLLIFFMITATYAALQKVLDMPSASTNKIDGVRTVTPEHVEEFMIKVQAREENGRPVIKVQDEPVALDDLVNKLSKYVGSEHRTEMVLDAVGVDWGTIVAIQDAAKGADIKQIYFQVSEKEARKAK
jgi:biopolymer transport protein ExbD